MPRIYTSASDPIDFCVPCFPPDRLARPQYGLMGVGPDGRGNCYDYDAEHPPYTDWDYRCHKCGKALTVEDDETEITWRENNANQG